MSRILYIDGDSWLRIPRVLKSLEQHYGIFENWLVINHAVDGDSNHDIINRTIKNIGKIKKLGHTPHVIVGLSEVGRGKGKELTLCPPDAKKEKPLNDYLKQLLLTEVDMLNKALEGCPSYVCSAWSTGINQNKNIVDFIVEKENLPEVFVLQGKLIEWFGKHRKQLGISQESLLGAIENSETYIQKLLQTNLVDDTIHVKNISTLQTDEGKNSTTEIYYNFFSHALANLS